MWFSPGSSVLLAFLVTPMSTPLADDHSRENPYQPPQDVGQEGYDPIVTFGSEAALNRVATGLNLVYWGIAITLLSIIGGALMVFASMAANSMGLVMFVGMAIGLGVIVGVLVGLVGRIFCMAVPPGTGAQPLIYAAVALDVVVLLVSIGSMVGVVPAWLPNSTNLLSLVATLLFVVFMKRVSTFIGRDDLASKAQGLITMGIVILGVAFLAGVGAAMLGPVALMLAMLVLMIMAILLVLRYVRLLVNLREAILARA
jgi:hypothetical protein